MKKKINKKIKQEVGHVVSFFSGVAKVQGLTGVLLNEVLLDENGVSTAIVIGFDEKSIEVLFFDENFDSQKNVFKSGNVFSVPVSFKSLGRVLNGFGKPMDGLGYVVGKKAPVFSQAPPIIDRQPVLDPLSTGIKIIDTSLPLGRGQRELIIGDRKLGKSTIAIDTILNQKNVKPEMYCVYVICGQKKQKLQELVSIFEKNNSFLYTVIIAATASTTFAEQYLAPFVGCAIGEYFKNQGKDALVIYDDLSKHAKVYRDVALLLERVPGREAYPGDIFSLHAGLLERSAKLSDEKGGGSLTALPIIETEEGDITSFISTNIISITDGQIYLERGLFQKGFIPAVNVGLSVSRVGSRVQPPLLRKSVGSVRLDLSQYKELQKLSQLETEVSKQTKEKIYRGGLILELLKQEKHTNVRWFEQVVLFYAINKGLFDDIDNKKWSDFEKFLLVLMRNRYSDVLKQVEKGVLDKSVEKKIDNIVIDFKQEFMINKKETISSLKDKKEKKGLSDKK